MTAWISKAGVTTIRRKRSNGSVSFKARVRVAGLTVFVISQKMSSASTAERAILMEKIMLANDRALGRKFRSSDDLARVAISGTRTPSRCALRSEWPESSGNSLCDTAIATIRNVSRKGSADMIVVMGLRCAIYSGTHSSQSSSKGGSIGAGVLEVRLKGVSSRGWVYEQRGHIHRVGVV
jgi:hypothetical protein